MIAPPARLKARLAAAAAIMGLLLTPALAPTAQADPKSPDCALATKINTESAHSFAGFGALNATSRIRNAFYAFRDHVAAAQSQAKDQELQATLADVSDASNELSGLLDQIKADPSVWGSRDFTFAVNNANIHHTEAGNRLTEATNAVCA